MGYPFCTVIQGPWSAANLWRKIQEKTQLYDLQFIEDKFYVKQQCSLKCHMKNCLYSSKVNSFRLLINRIFRSIHLQIKCIKIITKKKWHTQNSCQFMETCCFLVARKFKVILRTNCERKIIDGKTNEKKNKQTKRDQ